MAAASLNLFELAQQNDDRLKQQFDAYRSRLDDGRKPIIDEFAEQVTANGRISMNMRQSVLAAFLSSGKHQNINEFADAESGRTGESPDTVLKRLLGLYYERRMAYEGRFTEGRSFRYGALNICHDPHRC